MSHPLTAARSEVPPSLVRSELDRILASELFARSDRLSAFLRHIVDETLAGHGDGLKEHVLAMQLYGKGVDFNAAADPIVRVDARRLRDKLREYYATAPRSAVVISVPKGSYTPAFEIDEAQARTEPVSFPLRVVRDAPPAGRRLVSRRGLVVAAVAAALVVAAAWLTSFLRPDAIPPTRLLTVTSFPGAEDDPALSPDGNFVVFTWPGSGESGNDDLWIKPVEGDTLRRLTETPDAHEKWPQWSPDGRDIAFTRMRGRPGVYLISALGGPERRIADGTMPTWTPDGKALVLAASSPERISSLVHHVLETGARRVLTTAPAGFVEMNPRVSPDGSTLAFQRAGAGRSAVFTVPIAGGEPRLVNDWASGMIAALTWTPDGREIIYGRPETSGRRFVRTTPFAAQPTPVSGVPFPASSPTIPRTRAGEPYRLGFVTGLVDVGIRLVDLVPSAGATILAGTPLADATRMDSVGRFSPDSSEIAFVSDRSGSQQVWITARDGTRLRSVTRLEDATITVGSWSPDGQWVAFDATIAGAADLYVVRSDGGDLKRLTESPAIEVDPEWSRDGRWIFFSSNESGTPAIWKLPAGGGRRTQITTGVGYEPRQSPDGRSLYFIDQPRRFSRSVAGTLHHVPTDGGAASPVSGGIAAGAWDVTDRGIVFVTVRDVVAARAAPDTLSIYDFADRRVRLLGELDFQIAPAFTARYLVASRDGRWAVVARLDKYDRDIMVLENLR